MNLYSKNIFIKCGNRLKIVYVWRNRRTVIVVPSEKCWWKITAENAFMKTWKLVFYLKNAFYSLVEVFINEKKHSQSKGTHSLPFHTITECFLLDWKIVLRLNRKRSGPFHKQIEWVCVRSFWNGQKRIPSKLDYFLWRSLEKHLGMDSLNWRTRSRQSNIIPMKKRTYSRSFSKLTTAFQELKNQF